MYTTTQGTHYITFPYVHTYLPNKPRVTFNKKYQQSYGKYAIVLEQTACGAINNCDCGAVYYTLYLLNGEGIVHVTNVAIGQTIL